MKENLDFQSIRQQLEVQRASLQEHIKSEESRLGSPVGASPDPFDLAQDYHSKELGATLLRQAMRQLEQVEAALRRVDEDVYGTCIQCSASIAPSRLQVLPYALLCIRCQERRERSVARSQY